MSSAGCVCRAHVYQRNPADQGTVRALRKRREACTLSCYPRVRRVCWVQVKQKDRCACARVWRRMERLTKQRNKGKWRWNRRQTVERESWSPSSAEVSLRLSPCLSCNPRASLVCSDCCYHGKVKKSVRAFFWEGQLLYRSASTQHSVARGYTAQNTDVSLYNITNQISSTLFCYCGTIQNVIPAPGIIDCLFIPPVVLMR